MGYRTLVVMLLATLLVAACDSGSVQAERTQARQAPRPAAINPSPEADIPLGQLPPNVEPLHYRIDLTINPDQLRYEGRVEIDIELKAPRREFFMHGRNLVVGRVTASQPGRPDVRGTFTQVSPDGIAKVVFDQQLPAGKVTVALPFSAGFETEPDALTSMTDSGIRYVWTQFQEISARRAFPCFDEPRFKTPFDIAITHIGRHEAVSNTLPVARETIAEGVTRTTFATTAPLPTYLVAIMVGPYEIATGPVIAPSKLRPYPLPVRAVTVMGKSSAATYALVQTPPLVRTLEDYFAAPFPYPKLDLITPPNFSAGGMENAGAITYTERGILLGPRPDVAQRRYFMLLHAHEVAHQWFGDLVTPKWWNDIWLNEAFASWIGNKAAAQTWPGEELGRETQREALDVMDLDSLASARSIRQPIVTNDDIFNAFDGLTYDKGAAVLQMFEKYLGPDVFREGVRLHMRRFAHATADTNDFFASLSEAARKPGIVQAMETFLNQPGVPLVRVETACKDKDLEVRLTQSPYGATSTRDKRQWSIPVCMRELARGRSVACTMLDSKAQALILPKLCNVPVMPNDTANGYYRFTMPAEDWKRLVAATGAMNPAEKLATLHALRAALRAGEADAATYVAALRDAARAGEWDVVELVTTLLREIRGNLLEPDQHEAFEAGIRTWFGAELQALARDVARPAPPRGDTPAAAMARGAWSALAVDLARDPAVLQALAPLGETILKATASSPRDQPLDTRVPAALLAHVATGGVDAARTAIVALQASRQAELRNHIVRALAGARDPQAIATIQEFVLTGTLTARETRVYLREAFAAIEGRALAWTWLRARFERIVSITGEGGASRLIDLPARLCAPGSEDEIQSFFEPKAGSIAGAPRVLANTLETVRRCVAWRKEAGAAVAAAVTAPAPPPTKVKRR